MKCYNHNDRDAFGVCRFCGKGLCLECMKKDSDIVICANSESCNKQFELLNKSYKQINKNIAFQNFGKFLFIIFGMTILLITAFSGWYPVWLMVSILFTLLGLHRVYNLSSKKVFVITLIFVCIVCFIAGLLTPPIQQ